MSSSTFFSTSPFFTQTYHATDLDQPAPNWAHQARDKPSLYSGKGGEFPVSPYTYESVAFPQLQVVPRGADARHRVMEDRRHAQFNRTHSDLHLDRPLG